MPYNNLIPGPNDQLSQSQGQILANFQALAPCVGGIFAQQGAAPAVAVTEIGLFDLADGAGNPQLFLKRGNTGVVQNITGFTVPGAFPSFGASMLPSGLCLKWGAATILNRNAAAFTDIVYNNALATFSAQPYAVISLNMGQVLAYTPLASIGTSTALYLRIYNCSSSATNGLTVNYMAIGPVV